MSRYKTTYWDDVDKVKIPNVINREYINNNSILEIGVDSHTLDYMYGICGKDMEDIDMSELSVEDFLNISFDTNTIFSVEQLEKFKPNKILKECDEYYIGMNDLKEAGITGKGINIVILDDPFDHTIDDRFKDIKYNDDNVLEKNVSQFHGITVTDIIKRIAPEANIKFYATKLEDENSEKSKHEFDKKRYEILESIANSKENVDIISMSSTINSMDISEINKKLVNKGCKFIDSRTFSNNFAHANRRGKNILIKNLNYKISDEEYKNAIEKIHEEIEELKKENLEKEKYQEIMDTYERVLISKENYKIELVKRIENDAKKKISVVSGGITYIQNDGICGKKYAAHSSQSFSIPQVSAIYALAKQMDKNISYDEFCKICNETCIKEKNNLINPEGIIRIINEKNKKKAINSEEYKKIYENSSKLISNLDKVKEMKSKTI